MVWKTGFSFGDEVPAVGDFNGDGLDDIVTFYRSEYGGEPNGDALVSLNTFGDFGPRTLWHPFFGINDETVLTGDFNGDGLDDIITFLHGTLGRVYVALSNGSSFPLSSTSVWTDGLATLKQVPLIGDFNGDGLDDVAAYHDTAGEVFVALSTGTRFVLDGSWLSNFGVDRAIAGDFDGDGIDDFGGIRSDTSALATVQIAISKGFEFAAAEDWAHNVPFTGDYEVFASDFTGVAPDDLALVSPAGNLTVLPSEKSSFHWDPTSAVWNTRIRNSGQICLPGHFDRDLNADFAVFVSGGNNGDVKVALTGGHAAPDPIDPEVFGYGTMGLDNGMFEPVPERPAVQEVPLVLGLYEFQDRPDFGAPLGRDVAFFDNLFFGPGKPNIRDWFLEMSGGRFTFSRAGVYFIEIPETPDVDARAGMVDLLAEAGFDFRPYDTNGNGVVERDELCIASVSNFGVALGQTIGMNRTITYPSGPPAVLQTGFAGADHLGPVDLYAHEVTHLLASSDLYSSACYNDACTLMHCNGSVTDSHLVHFDAWHKMRLGWQRPLVYDVRDGPAQAALHPAQFDGNPPVLVYDSELGTDQYYLLEYRTPEYQSADRIWGGSAQDPEKFRRPPAPEGGYAFAGYDADVAKPGVFPWFAWMANPYDAVDEWIGINAGADGTLESIPAGDDTVTEVPVYDPATDTWVPERRLFAGPDNLLQSSVAQAIFPGANDTLNSVRAGDDVVSGQRILPGANGVLDSTRSGDDEVKNADVPRRDYSVYLAREPAMIAGRGSIDNIIEDNQLPLLKWRNAGGKEVYVGTRLNSPNVASIYWGAPFRPFFESWPSAEVVAGAAITVQGKLGANVSPGFGVYLECPINGDVTPLSVELWTPQVGIFEVPGETPPGDYLLYAKRTSSEDVITSNVVPITIKDTYGAWIAEHFSPAEAANPAITGPEVDLDGDGLGTLAEFAAMGNPRVAEPHLQPYLERVGSDLYAHIPLRTNLGSVRVRMMFSRNLVSWNEYTMRRDDRFDLGIPGLSRYSFRRVFSGRAFFRPTYTLVTK